MSQAVKVAFVSCRDQFAAAYIERLKSIYPELPLWVVSEFPPADLKWIPYKPNRRISENLARLRAALAGRTVRLAAIHLDPKSPYHAMRWMAFRLSPVGFIAFNEALDNFMLRPRCAATILRHFKWRLRDFLHFQLNPGGTWYTWAWRLKHPNAMRRPAYLVAGRVAGWAASIVRAVTPPRPDPPVQTKPDGISVIVPSRNGKDMISRLLPGVKEQLPSNGEIIVVDNGSDDGTAAWLRSEHPEVRVEESTSPLSFAAAVNRGIRAARYSRVCLLNNDMIIQPGFFAALRQTFDAVPDLFCATAQIFFPPGMRRQETGKAVWWGKEENRTVRDFPVRCLVPMDGEDQSYVLYGSGGCSMYSAAKLEQMGGFDEMLAPAYVEDLDLGWRGWQRNWPTVYVAAARVTHFHRSTTSRYYKPDLLQSFVEFNFLRFLARHVAAPAVFRRLWRAALDRLNQLAVDAPVFDALAENSLGFAWKATRLLQPAPANPWNEEWILGIGSGAVAVFPGRAKRGKSRVMVVSPYIPFPLSHGGAVRIYNLMRGAAAGFDQILVAFVEDLATPPEPLLDLCAEIVLVKRYGAHLFSDHGRPDVVEEFCSTSMQAALRQTVRKWSPGVAQLEFTQMAQYAEDCRPAKTILVEHDITYDLYEQLLAKGEDWETRRQYDRWVTFERDAWNRVDSVVVMSERDRKEASRHTVPAKVTCLANGVDLERFRPPASAPDPRRLLFLGSFQHLPNMMALEFFLRKCWPLLAGLHTVLHVIAGSRHEYFMERYRDSVSLRLDEPGIEVEGFISDVRPAYQRAAIVVAPLVASAGTNIKVMEAMAMGKPVVSTPAGVNGLDLTNGKDVIVVESADAMAAAIRELIENPDRRREIEREARLTVERDFDWQKISSQQRALYQRLNLRAGDGSSTR